MPLKDKTKQAAYFREREKRYRLRRAELRRLRRMERGQLSREEYLSKLKAGSIIGANAKLSLKLVAEIKGLCEAGYWNTRVFRALSLSELYCIPRNRCNNLTCGQSWKFVKGYSADTLKSNLVSRCRADHGFLIRVMMHIIILEISLLDNDRYKKHDIQKRESIEFFYRVCQAV
jgi:hypothetical protein